MKKLFSTTKRAVLSIIGIVVLAIVAAALLGGLVLSRSLIGKERAGEIALADAGLTEEEVSAFRVKLDYDDGRFCYEIDFYHDGAEYEYAIQAKDGDIFARDISEGGRRPANSQTASGAARTVYIAQEAGYFNVPLRMEVPFTYSAGTITYSLKSFSHAE